MKTVLFSLIAVALQGVPGGGSVDIPTGFKGDSLTPILNLVYTVAGLVAVIAIIIGGILYTTSDGDSGKLQKAKNAIVYSIVGLIFVILAAAITNFVLGSFK